MFVKFWISGNQSLDTFHSKETRFFGLPLVFPAYYSVMTARCASRGLEQRSGLRSGEAALASFVLGTQETIRCGCAHGGQLASTFLGEVKVLMPL